MRTEALPHPPLPRRRERDREVRVGLFVVAGLVTAIVLLFTLTDASLFRGRYKVYTTVADAGGVRRGDPVQMRGVNIGRIHGFEMTRGGVQLTLEIEGDYPIPADSRVELASGGLLGGRVASVHPGEAPQRVQDGTPLPALEPGAGLSQGIDGLSQQAQATLGQVQKLFSDETARNVQTSSAELAAMLGELRAMAAEQRTQVQELSRSLQRSARGLEKAVGGPELARSVQRMDAMTRQLEGSVASLDRSARSLEVVMGRMERGEGTLGRLSRDDSLYRNTNDAVVNLNRTAAELQQLVQDVKTNPRRYLNVEIF